MFLKEINMNYKDNILTTNPKVETLSDGRQQVVMKVLQLDVPNINNRIYPTESVEQMINGINECLPYVKPLLSIDWDEFCYTNKLWIDDGFLYAELTTRFVPIFTNDLLYYPAFACIGTLELVDSKTYVNDCVFSHINIIIVEK